VKIDIALDKVIVVKKELIVKIGAGDLMFMVKHIAEVFIVDDQQTFNNLRLVEKNYSLIEETELQCLPC